MNAQERYQELHAAARVAGPAAQLVVELHVPRGGSLGYAWCDGCVGTIQGDAPEWPDDCTTTQVIADALGVELEYRWRKPPQPPSPSRPGTADPVGDHGMDVLVHGEHAPPVIDAEQVAPDVARVTVTVDFPGGRDVLEAIVVTDAPREPGAVLAQRFTRGLSMSLRWAL